MTITWKVIEWLEEHYNHDKLSVEFLIAGKYISDQKHITENDFKESVEALPKRNDLKSKR
ncbi:hypothetical protein RO3G_02219 [Rhizopus delemar RA 99-880]|uniref:Uncharacterized protein n=1 Tax=Rhizopus delemar (strain RA 99-880 / ATCC MYA-4621 / FGSC 9543 / NRRL 43880) TaxID=246409 RepID=I1BMT5_RHIO9|nr:hypothetical protein RO3G_02219 [Rhizopus delemar RA 99-880]|eukprot:EIE77515.1 hypothetical protein RO3G_02219 [Rhizopus delemar RA 99-880]